MKRRKFFKKISILVGGLFSLGLTKSKTYAMSTGATGLSFEISCYALDFSQNTLNYDSGIDTVVKRDLIPRALKLVPKGTVVDIMAIKSSDYKPDAPLVKIRLCYDPYLKGKLFYKPHDNLCYDMYTTIGRFKI
jgi:hypothetical protein